MIPEIENEMKKLNAVGSKKLEKITEDTNISERKKIIEDIIAYYETQQQYQVKISNKSKKNTY